MKRNILIWLLVIALMFGPEIVYWASENISDINPNDYARITDMEYKAVLVDEEGSKGKIVVTERLTFDVHAASYDNLFWELWRDLCESYIDGLKVSYKVNSVKQILPNGTVLDWEESPKLYWYDSDYVSTNTKYGPGKWFHSPGPYNEYLQQYECLLFYVDGLYREQITFEIEYEMYNAVLRYGDCSDLYISMYSGETINHLQSLKAEILIPNKDMPKIGNYFTQTYGTNANTFELQESASKNPGYYTFSFELDEEALRFRPYNEYIEFELIAHGDDKHIFAEHASRNDYYNDNVLDTIRESQAEHVSLPQKYKEIKIWCCVGCALVALLFFGIGKCILLGIKRKYPSITPEIPCSTYREIPSDLDPKFAAAFVRFKHRKKEDDASVYAAILLSLARKEYVEILSSEKDATIVLTNYDTNAASWGLNDSNQKPKKELEALTPSEYHYYSLIKRHALHGSITMSNLQKRIAADYDNTSTFVRNMSRVVSEVGTKMKYIYKSNYFEPHTSLSSFAKSCYVFSALALLTNLFIFKTRLDLVFGGLFGLAAALIGIGIYFTMQSYRYVLLTVDGEREYRKWYGLYNFFKSDTLLNERTVVELPLWEKYLVYSTAFGVSEKVVNAIKIRCPEVALQPKTILNSNYCGSHHRIRTYSRSFNSSVRTGHRTSVSRSYSSGSYGGGFSGGYRGGGGRGGGGGGGGH